MKKIILSVFCVYAACNMVIAQTNMNREALSTKHKQAFDSLTKKSIDFSIIKEKYRDPLKNYERMNFPKEEIVLSNGTKAKFQTSDNKKVRNALSQIFNISPADFLIMLRNVHGRIEINPTMNQWVTDKDIPFLLKLANVDVVVPDITQDNSSLQPGVIKERTDYKKASMAINALKLITSYVLNDVFPSSEDGVCSYESVKNWYDSGKPKSDYKFTILYPIMGLHTPKRVQQPVKQDTAKKNQ